MVCDCIGTEDGFEAHQVSAAPSASESGPLTGGPQGTGCCCGRLVSITPFRAILDLGANIWIFSLDLSAPCWAVEIVSFEPLPGKCKMLRRMIAFNGLLESGAINSTGRRSAGRYEGSVQQESRVAGEGHGHVGCDFDAVERNLMQIDGSRTALEQ